MPAYLAASIVYTTKDRLAVEYVQRLPRQIIAAWNDYQAKESAAYANPTGAAKGWATKKYFYFADVCEWHGFSDLPRVGQILTRASRWMDLNTMEMMDVSGFVHA